MHTVVTGLLSKMIPKRNDREHRHILFLSIVFPLGVVAIAVKTYMKYLKPPVLWAFIISIRKYSYEFIFKIQKWKKLPWSWKFRNINIDWLVGKFTWWKHFYQCTTLCLFNLEDIVFVGETSYQDTFWFWMVEASKVLLQGGDWPVYCTDHWCRQHLPERVSWLYWQTCHHPSHWQVTIGHIS